MQWLKHVVVDVTVTLLIVYAATGGAGWARWIVLVYTPFMLVLRVASLLGRMPAQRRPHGGEAVPIAFYHLLFALNVAVPLAFAWHVVAAQWALLWILSVAAERRAPATPRRAAA